MAIIYIKQRKIQKILIPVFIIALLVITFIVWQGFFKEKKETLPGGFTLPRREIKIDFDFLKSPFLEKLQPFSEIEPFEEEIGRENPFIPY